jgi:hypothetical protein
MNVIFFLLAVLLVFYFFTSSEKFQNDVASDSQYEPAKALVSNDLNQAMIFATRDYLQKNQKLCGYCIETRSINKFVNKVDKSVKYKCRYMFLITDGYPYGISVDVEIGMDPEPVVLMLRTQPTTTTEDAKIVSYTDEVGKTFLSFDQMVASVKPKKLPTVN